MATYLANAFSLNMLVHTPVTLTVHQLPLEDARAIAREAIPAIGHVDTARLVARELAPDRENELVTTAQQRPSITLNAGDRVLVAQYRGPRLPEGSTTLPEGATIEYLLVSVA